MSALIESYVVVSKATAKGVIFTRVQLGDVSSDTYNVVVSSAIAMARGRGNTAADKFPPEGVSAMLGSQIEAYVEVTPV